MKRASKTASCGSKSVARKKVVDRLTTPRLLRNVAISQLFSEQERKTLPRGWKPDGWFAVEEIPLERLNVAAIAVGEELLPLAFASVEELRGVVAKVKNLAGRFQPADIRRR